MSFSFPKQSLSKDGNFKISVNLGDTNQDLKKKKNQEWLFSSPTKWNYHFLNSRKPNKKACHNRNKGI